MLFFVSQFQRVNPRTVSFAGPGRNAVATFVLQASQTDPASELAGGHSQIVLAGIAKAVGHLDPTTSAARGEVYVGAAVSFGRPVTDVRGRVLRVSIERRRMERFGSIASPRFALFGAPSLATAGLINSSPVLDPVLQ